MGFVATYSVLTTVPRGKAVKECWFGNDKATQIFEISAVTCNQKMTVHVSLCQTFKYLLSFVIVVLLSNL